MSPLEALSLLLEGKKIRKTTWVPNCFLYLCGNRIFNQNNNFDNFVVNSHIEEWQEYVPKLCWDDIKVGMKLMFTDRAYMVSFKNDYMFLITDDISEEFFTVIKVDFESCNSTFRKVT